MNEVVSQAASLLAKDPTIAGARAALAAIGLRFPKQLEVDPQSPGQLPDYPCVLKVSEPFIAHKTEMGAVRICEHLTFELLKEFADSVSKRINSPVTRVTIEEKITIPEGGETLLSVLFDDSFGPVVVFGEGGRLTELRKSVTRWLSDEPAESIARLLERAPLAKCWFSEYRTMPPLVALKPFSELLNRLGAMVHAFHELRPDLILRDLEINPVALTTSEPVALDLLLTVEPADSRRKTTCTRPDLTRLAHSLFQAKHIAVAGVSTTDSNNLGRVLYERLRSEFGGQSWAINPKGGEIDGIPVFKSVAELPSAPDVLVLALSSRFTAPTLEQAYAKFGDDLGAVLMLASGYDETSGGAENAAVLKSVVQAVGGTPLLGPNTMALFAQTGSRGDARVNFLPQGRVSMPSFKNEADNNTALILQSGARFASFLDRQPAIGFRWSIMVGNAYQTDVADGLELAAGDPKTRVIAVYLEGLHPGAGERLARAVRLCKQQGKVVVIQKGGRTARGAATARSHTASMSGSHDVFQAIVTQAGALVVNSETDFIDVVRVASLLESKRAQGPNLFIINGAGYEGVLASDEAANQGLELPKPPATVSEVLSPFLGKILDSTNNPADVGPATPDVAYGPTLEAALASPIYDAAVVAVMPHGNGMTGVLPPYEGEGLLGPALVELSQRFSKPIIVSVNGGAKYEGFRQYLESHGVPVFPEAEQAVRALGLWYKLTQG